MKDISATQKYDAEFDISLRRERYLKREKMRKKNIKNWEEEFDEICYDENLGRKTYFRKREALKIFIRKLINNILDYKELKKLEYPEYDSMVGEDMYSMREESFVQGYNRAIEDLAYKINNLRKEK